MVISEGLTQEAVRAMVASGGCIEPLYVSQLSDTKWLPYVTEALDIVGLDFADLVLRRIGKKMKIEVTEFRTTTRETAGRPRPIHEATALQVRSPRWPAWTRPCPLPSRHPNPSRAACAGPAPQAGQLKALLGWQ